LTKRVFFEILTLTKGPKIMNESFSEILRDYVRCERQKNPSANETSISKKMDIPVATFNRLMNGHFNPNMTTVLTLSQFIPVMRVLLPKDISRVLEVSKA